MPPARAHHDTAQRAMLCLILQASAAIVSADAFAFVPRACSLDANALCGVNMFGEGTYTAEGIVAISEMLKVNTTLQSIRCVLRMLAF